MTTEERDAWWRERPSATPLSERELIQNGSMLLGYRLQKRVKLVVTEERVDLNQLCEFRDRLLCHGAESVAIVSLWLEEKRP